MITENEILNYYEKELLNSLKELHIHNNIEEISRDCFMIWQEEKLQAIVLNLIKKDINFNRLAENLLLIAIEKQEKDILESYNQYDFSFNISKHFLGYFENGNQDNLNNEDLKQIENFMIDKQYMAYNSVYIDGEDFRQCKITNLSSDCVEMFFNKNKIDIA